jgi:hypothetical protein
VAIRETTVPDVQNGQPLRSVQDKGKRMKDKGLIALGGILVFVIRDRGSAPLACS